MHYQELLFAVRNGAPLSHYQQTGGNLNLDALKRRVEKVGREIVEEERTRDKGPKKFLLCRRGWDGRGWAGEKGGTGRGLGGEETEGGNAQRGPLIPAEQEEDRVRRSISDFYNYLNDGDTTTDLPAGRLARGTT